MFLTQYYLKCLAHASYLIGDEASATAAVVDPQRDVDQYLEEARGRGLTIRHVLLTHLHADFVAGHLELRERTGAAIYLGRLARADYPFTPLGQGEGITFGRVRLSVLETPGHSPESVSILVRDLGRDAAVPHAVLTGDTLFIGDVGRPDLRAAQGWRAEDLARALYRSLRERLLPLPDDTLVYPAHGAGSLCGKQLSAETVSTMGVQRRYNYALQPMPEDEFVRIVLADQPDAPAYFAYDADLNARERPTLEAALARGLRALSPAEALRAQHAGAQVLDTREPAAFAGAHLRGALNVGLDGQFASWAGTLLDPERPVVIVAAPGREVESATRLGRVGFDRVTGYLAGGMEALDGRPDLLARTERVTVATLAEWLAAPEPPVVLDVRTPGERRAGRIAGSVHVPLNRLLERLAEVPRARRVAVHCQSGYRSAMAASLLAARGREGLADVVGGFAAWQASGLPVEAA